MSKTNKASLVSLIRVLVAGLQGLVGVDSFVLADTTYTKAQIIATLNAYVAAVDAAAAAQLQYRAATKAQTAARVSVVSLRNLLRGFFETRFGKGNPQLAQYSFGPTPSAPR